MWGKKQQAHQGHVREKTGDSGRHDRQDLTQEDSENIHSLYNPLSSYIYFTAIATKFHALIFLAL